jgi:hypothetical protein
VGIIATVIVAAGVVLAIGVGVMSIPDIRRYLAIRRM